MRELELSDGTTINSTLTDRPFPTSGNEYTVQSPTFAIFGTGQYVNVDIELPGSAMSNLSEITFSGFALPEPSAAAICCFGVMFLICQRSRRRST